MQTLFKPLPKKICIEGTKHLLQYLEKLLQQALHECLELNDLPTELIPAFNQFQTLVNAGPCGLTLPPKMIADMLNQIRCTLVDYPLENHREPPQSFAHR